MSRMREKQEGRIIYGFKYDAKAERITYYFLLADETLEDIDRLKPLIAFPLRREFMDAVIVAAQYNYGEVKRRGDCVVGGFRNHIDYKRHLIASLIFASMKRYNKELVNEAIYIASNLNPIFVNILVNVAKDRYFVDPSNLDQLLAVGKSLRILYELEEPEEMREFMEEIGEDVEEE